MKKTVCLVTDWYPTMKNPYVGCFFKEQAFVVADKFDFVVFRFKEKWSLNPFKRDYIVKCNQEENTVEYDAVAYMSIIVLLYDFIYSFLVKRYGERIDGIGRYISPYRRNLVKRKIGRLFSRIKESVNVFYCVDAQNEAFYLQSLSELVNKPYVVGEHAPVPWPGTLITDLNKFAIENADLFLAISNDKIRQLLLQNIKLPKTVYIGNLIDERKLTYHPHSDNHVKTFVIVAAHSFYKNYDMFIQVINRLTEITVKEFRVMIVGYGANKGYSKDEDVLEKKIRESKFADKAELIPEVPHEEIGEIYNRADAFVMTSIQEGQPVSAMEAACCGLPIFSTCCGGVEDYIDEENGRIYGVVDIDDMANGLKDYLEGTITFEPLRIRKKIVDRFGVDAFRKNFIKAIQKAMEE